MVTFKFSVQEQGGRLRDEQIVLGDPVKTQNEPEVYACELTMGSGPARAIFGASPIGAVANAMTVTKALVESRGDVVWR